MLEHNSDFLLLREGESRAPLIKTEHVMWLTFIKATLLVEEKVLLPLWI